MSSENEKQEMILSQDTEEGSPPQNKRAGVFIRCDADTSERFKSYCLNHKMDYKSALQYLLMQEQRVATISEFALKKDVDDLQKKVENLTTALISFALSVDPKWRENLIGKLRSKEGQNEVDELFKAIATCTKAVKEKRNEEKVKEKMD